MKRMKLKRKDFAAWLKKNARKEYETGEICDCALAKYLIEVRGESVRVLPDVAYSNEWQIKLPKWAQHFVSAFDAIEGRFVSGKRALTLL